LRCEPDFQLAIERFSAFFVAVEDGVPNRRLCLEFL
jgi:hypothetical protein